MCRPNGLQALLEAAAPWLRAVPFLWLEASPQHFPPNASWSSNCSERPGALPTPSLLPAVRVLERVTRNHNLTCKLVNL